MRKLHPTLLLAMSLCGACNVPEPASSATVTPASAPAAPAAAPKPDTSARTDAPQPRAKPAAGSGILAVGDSLTAENGAQSWPNQLAGLVDSKVVGAGVGGERMMGGARRMGALLDRHGSRLVLWMEGTNDVTGGFTRDSVNAAVAVASEACANHGAKLVVLSVPPCVGLSAVRNSANATLNGYLKSACAALGIRMLDTGAALSGCVDCFDADGAHLSVSGAFAVAEVASRRLVIFNTIGVVAPPGWSRRGFYFAKEFQCLSSMQIISARCLIR